MSKFTRAFGYLVMLSNVCLAAWQGSHGHTEKAILSVLFAIFVSVEMRNE